MPLGEARRTPGSRSGNIESVPDTWKPPIATLIRGNVAQDIYGFFITDDNFVGDGLISYGPDRVDQPDDYDWLIETGTACIGTPDDAIAYIDKLLKGSGGFGVIMELAHNWADWDATRRHYELMARYVHAHFQKSFAPRVEAYAAAATQQKEFAGQAAQAVQSEIDKLAARQKTGT
jgi:hypothetical protein